MTLRLGPTLSPSLSHGETVEYRHGELQRTGRVKTRRVAALGREVQRRASAQPALPNRALPGPPFDAIRPTGSLSEKALDSAPGTGTPGVGPGVSDFALARPGNKPDLADGMRP